MKNRAVLSGVRQRVDDWLPVLALCGIGAIVIMVLLSGGDGIDCNPDAVSVFTNQRECRVTGHVPMGPRVP